MNFTKEQIEKAMACKSVDELLTLAKSEGVELTREQAETYFSQLRMNELTAEELAKVAGGAGILVAGQMPNPNCLDDLDNTGRCKADCSTYDYVRGS